MLSYDALVYGGRGGEEAAIMCAISCADAGLRTALVVADFRIGGMTAGGLAGQDRGKPARRMRGILQEFEQRLGWAHGYGITLTGRPRRAEQVFFEMIGRAGRRSGGRVDLFLDEPLAVVTKTGPRITSITTGSGRVFTANNYIDASRSLMLIGMAGERGQLWTIGRESEAAYGESLAGYGKVKIPVGGSPYVPGTTNLLSGISPNPGTATGASDDGCQAPTYRVLYSDDPLNLIAFDHPTRIDLTGYNRNDHLMAAQLISADSSIRGTGIGAGVFAGNYDQLITDPATGRPLHWDYDLKT